MIKNLLLLFAFLCLSVLSRAQTNLTYNDKSNTGFITSEAVGYFNGDGVFYYNYGKTTKVSNSSSIVNLVMFEKDMVWMEEYGGVIFLYLYDGKTRLNLASGQSISDITVTVDYVLYINYTSGQRQVYRYDRRTGVTTQMTNETSGAYTLLVTDSRTATFTFTYATANPAKPGNYYLISSKPGAPRTIVYDEYNGNGFLSGGKIFFISYVGVSYQLIVCDPRLTGAAAVFQTTLNVSNPYISGNSEKYVTITSYDGVTSQSLFMVYESATSSKVFERSGWGLFGANYKNEKITWYESDGNDYEIMYFDGKEIKKLTDNSIGDANPVILGDGNIAWLESLNNSFYDNIVLYDVISGTTTRLNKDGLRFSQIQSDGANILASDFTNGTTQLYLYTVSRFKLGSLDFRCDETSKNGTAVFSIEQPLKQGVIGLDFKVNFDPNAVSVSSVDVLNATDANGNTAVLTYQVSGNTISVSYYLRSAPAGASITATGPIIGINLVRNAGTTYTSSFSLLKVSEVEESYAIGSLKSSGPVPASYNVSSETFIGQLLYGGILNRPVVHSANNPFVLYQTDYACVKQPLTSAVVNPGTTGVFRINKNTVNSNLQFVKDLPGNSSVSCTNSNIMTFMNGSDWALTADISKGNSSAVTSPLQYFAADVNMDGKVTAGDAALISSRSVLKICEYPQKWNYVLQNGIPVPGPNYKPSKDFVFVHESMFTATASRDAVPVVSDCLPMPGVQTCPASDALATKYAAILLGDANLSYYPSNVLTRVGMTNDVVFTADGDPEIVNVSGTCSERLKALDFRVVLPEGVMVEDVVAAHPDVNVNWNAIDSLLLVTSYVDGDISAPEHLFDIVLKNGLLNNLSAGDFYINGEPAGFANRIVNGTTDLVKRQVKISPNPTDGIFRLEFRESRSGFITVSDIEGKIISRTFTYGTSQELNIEEAPAGVYLVKIESENTTEVYKIVKQ